MQVAGDEGFLLMFRGEKLLPLGEQDLFLIGRKALPAYYRGDMDKLRNTPSALAKNENLFRDLATDFVNSPMHHKRPTLCFPRLFGQKTD
jgi:hypothetical protein